MPVAKSYANLPIVGKPYEKNKRMYVLVSKNGANKEVRWYSEIEYAKMYGLPEPKLFDPVKAFGFGNINGHIILIDGSHEALRDFNAIFKKFRYDLLFGWHTTQEKFDSLAAENVCMEFGFCPLNWREVGDEKGDLFSEEEVRMAVNERRGIAFGTSRTSK